MFRRFALVVAVLATMLSAHAAAQTTSYASVNIHNGFIQVRNEVVVRPYDKAIIDEANVRLDLGQRSLESAKVKSGGGTVSFNRCCILAGTLYKVEIYVIGKRVTAMVRPQLCNLKGIPFGFAVVTFTGTANRDHSNNWIVNVEPHVPPVNCPTDFPR